MATQQQIAEHLDLSQQQISNIMARLGIDWKTASMDHVRIAYIRHLRVVAAGHESSGGDSLVAERILSERVDRELKELTLAEKKGTLINVAQLEPELMNMVSAFRTELLSRDDKLASDLATLYGIQVDVAILNEFTNAALLQLSRYDVARDRG
ncbi:MAG: MarR family transcriptional regulator [Nitrosomonadales bacterium]|nr:MarR family transcriptional regulator [Nitrosomonadales bacterium]